MRRAPPIRLHGWERRELALAADNPRQRTRVRLRARIVLRAAAGLSNQRIAQELSTDASTVARWRRRFLLHGSAGVLRDAPRPGRPPVISDGVVERIVRRARERRPEGVAARSTRSVARESGVSKSTVQRIWKARGVESPRGTARPAADGRVGFLDSVTDMVGVYLDPPERAIAFSTDPRLARRVPAAATSPSPVRPRRKRSGTEFRAFLEQIDRRTPTDQEVHLLIDSRWASVPVELRRWLARHGRFFLHYLPADQLGLSLVDRLVAEFSRGSPRAGESPSAQRLRLAVRDHLRQSRGVARPFIWTTSPSGMRGVSPE